MPAGVHIFVCHLRVFFISIKVKQIDGGSAMLKPAKIIVPPELLFALATVLTVAYILSRM